MTDPDPRYVPVRTRTPSPFAWVLPLALTALVIVLAWRLARPPEPDVRDPDVKPRVVTPRGDLAADERATIELFDVASPAVVQVTNLHRDITGMSQTEQPQGTGSGFVWDPRGYVVTNFHVVAQGDAFAVTFADHRTFEAHLVGGDPHHDLAVLKIDPGTNDLPALALGTSADLAVGQKVFAIGNPFGLDQTLTTGVVSGIGREITSLMGTPIQGVIQTDAAINPGNSGGPLLDSAGRVIGLNTQIASPSGASAGIGFAIPVDTMNRIVPEIIRTGRYLRPGLGVVLLEDWVAPRFGTRGVVIGRVFPDGAAAQAGLRPTQVSAGRLVALGDSIVAIDGIDVASRADLFRILDSRKIGDSVDVTYLRDGARHTTKLTLVGIE